LRIFASAIGEIFVFSDDFKTAFSAALLSTRCCPLLTWRKRPVDYKVEHPIERYDTSKAHSRPIQ
jgi:hypothetical protein